LVFAGCWRYRLGSPNDEGWYRHGDRFGRLAPGWGQFYEVEGELLAAQVPDWTLLGEPPPGRSRHFLFYLRDETFECDARDWRIELPAPVKASG